MDTSTINYKKMSSLFLQQSYIDSWEDYCRSIHQTNFAKWDYVILTASNEAQAEAFRMQIAERLKQKLLPASTTYAVIPDPDGKRVGSGGATFNVMRYLARESGDDPVFAGKRILVIHSGGDSKRVPQYSAIGKLFSPVPRKLPDGRGSTLFDEFIIGMSGVPSRLREGMLVLSGDVLLLFNPLQIDGQLEGAAAISIKEPVEIGKDHGVFLNDGHGKVKHFLHKQTVESLREIGAVNEHGAVDLDTGAILMDADLLNALYGLISTDGKVDDAKFDAFVNDRARISFYGDLLYPLAGASTLEQYYKEKPEGDYTQELHDCRTKIWKAIEAFSMKLICLSPAKFIHFGTTHELLSLVTQEIDEYEFLNWKAKVATTGGGENHFAAYNSYIGHRAKVQEGAYIEDSYVLDESMVGYGSVLSNVKLRDVAIPAQVVIHGLPLQNDRYVTRIYGVLDNPKATVAEQASFLCSTLPDVIRQLGLKDEDLWEQDELDTKALWNAKLYPVCDTEADSVAWALRLYELVAQKRSGKELDAVREAWLAMPRMSLCESYNLADMKKILAYQEDLKNRILCHEFIEKLLGGAYYQEAFSVFGTCDITEGIYRTLMQDAKEMDFSAKIRIYYALAEYMKQKNLVFDGHNYEYPQQCCFGEICDTVYEQAVKKLPDSKAYRIAKDEVHVELPVRVNWGGGWTDTPPYCNENGGIVLNAAISLNGILPIQITVRRLAEYVVEFESQDIGAHGVIRTKEEILACHDPYDPFALHKAALIACGIVPQGAEAESLEEILRRIGGGIYLSTQVIGIPKGSGLGTSSILAGACVKGIFAFLGLDKTNSEIYEIVLCMEQIMSTGGGWQDQVGGLTNGIKLITTAPGLEQRIRVQEISVPEAAMRELQERFAVIYTGQRRLARNLLRDVVGGYIGARPESVQALQAMKPVAALMAFYLQMGDIDAFANLLNEHWKLSLQLDAGSTNRCIDQIFLACEDLIDARFIAGAGGGGFLMVILKKGITRQMLHERLSAIFQDSGVDVWESAFV